MKKLYYLIVGVVIIIFLYFIFSSLPTFLTKFTTVAQNSINTSSFSSSGSFGYKATSEREDLLKEMISINSNFIKNPPISFPKNNDDIKYFYKLTKCFSNFKTYYIAKLKVKDVLFNELPILLKNTSSLNETDLKTYFNNNATYLDNKWGINNFNDFFELVLTIKELNGKEITSYELEESYFYIESLKTANFRIIITPSDNTPIYIAGVIDVYGNTKHQTAPAVKFLGTVLGGIS